MPIYEYRCGQCGATIERLEMGGQQALPLCAACNQVMEKILSAGQSHVISQGASSGAGASCCGAKTPCANPKHCCGH
jgi:putative FmdB family regulatory protein